MVRLIGVVVLIVVAVAAYIWWPTPPVRVVITRIDTGRVEETVTNTRVGTVKAKRRASVAPMTSGKVVLLKAKEGDRVEAGDLLLELWNDDLKAQLALTKSRVEVTRARHEEACLNTEYYEREAERLRQLAAEGTESAERADIAATRAAAGRSACEATLAEIASAEAEVALAQASLEQTRLRAPFSGVVAEVNCELGEVVSPSPPGIPTPPAIELIDSSRPYVSAPIDEVDAPKIRVGMRAHILLDAIPDQTYAGTVDRVAPYVLDLEKQARTVEVEVVFDDPERLDWLIPGYSADAEILIEAREQALRIPTEALTNRGTVFVVTSDDTLDERKVHIGLTNWRYSVVSEGLSGGDRVVLNWQQDGIENGVRVRSEAENESPKAR